MSGSEHLIRLRKEHICFIENGFDSPIRRIVEDQIATKGGNVEFVDTPFVRHLEQTKEQSDCFNIVTLRDPLLHLMHLFSYYYEKGRDANSFRFYRVFFQKVEQLDLAKKEGVREFVAWLKASDIRTIYDPQLAGIDVRKNIEDALEVIDSNCDFVAIEEKSNSFAKWLGIEEKNDIDKYHGEAMTPFSRLDAEQHFTFFAPFVNKDRLLYEKAEIIFSRQMSTGLYGKEYRALADNYEGVVDWISENKVAGWVFEQGKGPLSVRVCVNGMEVGTTLANRHRAALQRNGRHPDGRCGFAMDFETVLLTSSDRVDVFIDSVNIPIKIGKKAIQFKTEAQRE